MGLFLSSDGTYSLTCFCDVDWASCPNTRSLIGYLLKFGDSLISWKSKKQHTVSRSSAKAKYRSMVAVTTEVVWLLGLFVELGVPIKRRVDVYCDSKASLQIAANPIYHERTKHMEINCHFVPDKIIEGTLITNLWELKTNKLTYLQKCLDRFNMHFS